MVELEVSADEVRDFAASLVRLQRVAYAVEAALIRDDRIPALRESEDELVAAGLHWLLETENGRIVGALAYQVDDGTVDVDRLVVDPAHHRRGIGARLVRRVLQTAPRVVVSTGRDNLPARRLYEAAGFAHERDREVLPGLYVSDYASRS
ncbi:GNAT family N-acetyltransferase [Agromyces laixinhei]|uniref:GNAT family N-acetyltransferase n=1 Tax=Agromyces laixinhei TaxID=2585717 RepID=UPI0012EDE402|nr:GNAT family N-acetyltransferase [Agromyces laixinhei]